MAGRFLVALMVGFVALSGCVQNPSPNVDSSTNGPAVLLGPAQGPKPFLHILSGHLEETPAVVRAVMTVASLDAKTIAAEMTTAGYTTAMLSLCWNPVEGSGGVSGIECAYLEIKATDTQPFTGGFSLSSPVGCNDWWWCVWRVPFEVQEGSPATVRVEVPRELMPNNTLGSSLESPLLQVFARKADPAPPGSAIGRGYNVGVCVPVRCTQQMSGVSKLDRAQGAMGPSFNLTLPMQGALGMPSPQTILQGRAKDVSVGAQGYRADLDILSVDIEETATEVAYITKVANLPVAANHAYDMEFAVGGKTYEAWYQATLGQVHDAGGDYCLDPECEQWGTLSVNVKLTPGTPGTIRAALKWSEMAKPEKGALVTLAEVDISDPNVYQFRSPAPGVYAFAVTYWNGDSLYHAQPYYLKQGAPA